MYATTVAEAVISLHSHEHGCVMSVQCPLSILWNVLVLLLRTRTHIHVQWEPHIEKMHSDLRHLTYKPH